MGRTGQASIHAVLDDFTTKLKRRQFPASSVALARHTTELLIHAVAAQQALTVGGIIEGVRLVSKKLVDARPLELVVGNMCRRVLHIIREEAVEHAGGSGALGTGTGGVAQMETGAVTGGGGENDQQTRMKRFKQDVIESVGELIDELETAEGHCAVQAVEHVTPGCVVLTAGGSCSVEAFLREANKKRTFQCVVAEGEPGGAGHRLAKLLADKGVATTVIADAATFAVMPRCHLVVLGAKGVFHDGTALCAAGHRAVAVAAKAHRVPVLVLAGTHELSPLGPGDPEYDMDDLKSPCEIFDFAGRDASGFSANSNAVSSADDSPNPAELQIANPDFDRVSPDLISLFVTDAGGQVPGFIASLLAEFYSPEDRRFD